MMIAHGTETEMLVGGFSSLCELKLETSTMKVVIKTKMNKIPILSILYFNGRSIRAKHYNFYNVNIINYDYNQGTTTVTMTL